MRNAAAEKLLSTANSTGFALTEDAFAAHMDSIDPLKEHRESFHIPKLRDGSHCTYLVGNNLGLQHVGVEASIAQQLKKWREQGVEGHLMQPSPWIDADSLLRKDMASIVGASESEVVVMNSLTVNMHLLMAAFYKPTSTKKKIVMENQAFPSDTHCIISQLQMHGLNAKDDLITVSAPDHDDWKSQPAVVPTEAFLSVLDKRGDEVAMVVLSAVHFLTGQFFDVAAVVKAAHAKNILVGVDAAHAVGNVPLKLHDWGVDFACWCTYKYLNSGPGNVAAAFVHSKHTFPGNTLAYLKGWWGHERKQRLSLHRSFEPEEGAAALQVSSPPVLGIAALAPSVRLIASVGMAPLRDKSTHLTAYMELLLNELVPGGCIEIITPVDPAQRGAQLSIRIVPNKLKSESSTAESFECSPGVDACDADLAQRQLMDEGVIVSSRAPDIIHLAPVPLYNTFQDVLNAAHHIGSLFQ